MEVLLSEFGTMLSWMTGKGFRIQVSIVHTAAESTVMMESVLRTDSRVSRETFVVCQCFGLTFAVKACKRMLPF
jgi:hypothetical protein